ncbi:MAG: hypothetical protein ACLFS4_00005, partial [Opitutales bacterium]
SVTEPFDSPSAGSGRPALERRIRAVDTLPASIRSPSTGSLRLLRPLRPLRQAPFGKLRIQKQDRQAQDRQAPFDPFGKLTAGRLRIHKQGRLAQGETPCLR